MARGKVVRREVEEKVRFLLRTDKKLRGKELKEQVEKEFPDINYTVRTYQLLKEKAQPALSNLKDLDEDWHIGTLRESPLPPVVVARILKLMKSTGMELTKREVQWVSRFHELFKEDDELWHVVMWYSMWEIYGGLTGNEFITTRLDRELAEKGDLKYFIERISASKSTNDLLKACVYQLNGNGPAEDFLEILKGNKEW